MILLLVSGIQARFHDMTDEMKKRMEEFANRIKVLPSPIEQPISTMVSQAVSENKPPCKIVEMAELHKKIEAVLREHDYKESKILSGHPYWDMLNRYRGLKNG